MADSKELTLKQVLTDLTAFVGRYKTRQEAAEALGVSRTFLWKVEQGHANPTQSMLEKLGYSRERKITYAYFKVSENG